LKIGKNSPLHLTYCLNVHPGETWDENFDAIRSVTLEIRKRVSPNVPFGLGLRLGHTAAGQLANSKTLRQFKAFLEPHDLYVFTVNGFPYGEFHKAPVKERVYSPDWRSKKRLDYTILLAEILSNLLPEGLSGSISTVPGSYKGWIHGLTDRTEMIQNLMRCVAHLAHIHKETGKELHLGLEPEPDCFLETTDETIDFFTRDLRGEGKRYLTQLTGTSEEEANDMIKQHLGVCFDTCHMSLQFEDLGESISRLAAHGIRLSKVQVSAALKIGSFEKSLERVKDFCDPVYLHQVKARMVSGEIRPYEDLPPALSDEDILSQKFEQMRIHFHVPLYFSGDRELGSSGSDLSEDFFYAAAGTGCTHFEIETYTFHVLPLHLKRKNLAESITEEYAWVLNRLST
jgi:sugar phosphate isomerase/epimerase